MWLSWEQAAVASAVLAVLGILARPVARRGVAGVGAVLREAALILALYALWQKMGELAVTGTAGGVAHARAIWHVENLLHLPIERDVQHLILPHPVVVQALNIYYAVVHV